MHRRYDPSHKKMTNIHSTHWPIFLLLTHTILNCFRTFQNHAQLTTLRRRLWYSRVNLATPMWALWLIEHLHSWSCKWATTIGFFSSLIAGPHATSHLQSPCPVEGSLVLTQINYFPLKICHMVCSHLLRATCILCGNYILAQIKMK
jgi:hypothetical protein